MHGGNQDGLLLHRTLSEKCLRQVGKTVSRVRF